MGDEPAGSGKFIASAETPNKRCNQPERKGRSYARICNGFQALIKLGLVPYGEIRDMNDNSPNSLPLIQ